MILQKRLGHKFAARIASTLHYFTIDPYFCREKTRVSYNISTKNTFILIQFGHLEIVYTLAASALLGYTWFK
jgi:hypothetical protein